MKNIVIFCFFLAVSEGRQPLPSGMKACSRSDPNLNQCFAKNANSAMGYMANGVPEYNIPSLRPLNWRNEFVIDTPPFKLSLQNIMVSGADNLTISDPHVDLKNNTIQHQFSSPEIVWNQRFVAEMTIGNRTDRIEGHSTIAFRKSTWNMTYGYEFQEFNGTHYANITNPRAKCHQADLHFNFGDLDNHSAFREPLNNLKRNFISPELEQLVGDTAGGFYNKIFNVVPFNEVFIP